MWLSNQARPDILNAVRAVARVLCGAFFVALAGGAAHQIDEYLRNHFSVGSR